ncbi:MAG: hypothetical protein IKL58_00325 [Phascolarctobacterium sp.]|nr:hypothetical protein [Phascolarctobacterium sp.]
MTPERKAYLDRCSDKERRLHRMIKSAKRELSYSKEDMKLIPGLPFLKWRVKYAKVVLSAYRHELARLKGMDRVCVPKVTDAHILGGLRLWCACGKQLSRSNKYCPACGRKILWEKVK